MGHSLKIKPSRCVQEISGICDVWNFKRKTNTNIVRSYKHNPFILYTKSGRPFESVIVDNEDSFSSPFLLLKSFDEE
jgi:hypothetical protein